MSGIINKVKNAVSGEKHTPEAVAANQGNNGECFQVNQSRPLDLGALIQTPRL